MSAPTRASHVGRLVATLGAVAMLAAACGGGGGELEAIDDATPDDDTVVTVEDPTETPAPTAEPTEGDDGTGVDGADEEATATPEETATPAPGEVRPTATPAPVSGAPAFTEDSKLTTVGLDEVFFGDQVDDAAEKADTTWVGLPAEGAGPQCYTVQPSGGPTGVVLTVIDGHIERIDISTTVITTRSGAGVGTTEAELAELFGATLETTAVDGGNEIAFVPQSEDDAAFRIIWTTDGTTTTHMRAGRLPYVTPSTPCSG